MTRTEDPTPTLFRLPPPSFGAERPATDLPEQRFVPPLDLQPQVIGAAGERQMQVLNGQTELPVEGTDDRDS